MKKSLFITMLAAAIMGSGLAEAKSVLRASEYTDQYLWFGSDEDYVKFVVDQTLTLTSLSADICLYDGATFEFLSDNSGALCCIYTPTARVGFFTVDFINPADVYNFTIQEAAQAVVAASNGTPMTLIEDLCLETKGFSFPSEDPEATTILLNGAGYGETVSIDGLQFTYVGPKEDGYVFQAGEIGFTGYNQGSHKLSLVAKPTPEPTTGTLSLLALAALAARRRRK